MTQLFDPFALRSLTLKNRIGISPMCMYSSSEGQANEFHIAHLGARAAGGAGLVIAEATAVEARGRITPFDAGLWSDAHIEPLSHVTREVRRYGAVAGIQLAHAGRKASMDRPWGLAPNQALDTAHGGWPVVGPCAIPYSPNYHTPLALSVGEIHAITDAFVAATQRALAAGYQLIELHGAHGYLLHEFLSPLSNQRDDDYGGSFDNRTRFLCEVVRAVRAAWPEHLPLGVRLSCTDWAPGGWAEADSIALAKILKSEAVDFIDCSSGGNSSTQKIPLGPGYQVPFAASIRAQAGIATAAVGLITNAAQANAIVAQGQADLVFLAREALRNPMFPWHAARALGHPEAVHLPPQYARAE